MPTENKSSRKTVYAHERETESDQCPECQSKNIQRDYDRGEKVCTNCGYVINSQLTDRGPEWRIYTPEEVASKTRVGLPPTFTLQDKGLSTLVGTTDRYGHSLKSQQKADAYRLRKCQNRTINSKSKDRSLSYILSEINNTCNQLNLPKNVVETSGSIARKAVKEGITRGISLKSIANGCVRVASKQCGVPRRLSEVAEVSHNGNTCLREWRKDVGRSERTLQRELGYEYQSPTSIAVDNIPVEKPEDYVEKIAGRLGLSGGTEGFIYKIIAEARKINKVGLVTGRGPHGIASAAAYIASILSSERKTQSEIAEISGVTEVTVRNRYKDLNRNLMFEIYL